MEYPLEQLLTGKYTLSSVEKGYFDPVGEYKFTMRSIRKIPKLIFTYYALVTL